MQRIVFRSLALSALRPESSQPTKVLAAFFLLCAIPLCARTSTVSKELRCCWKLIGLFTSEALWPMAFGLLRAERANRFFFRIQNLSLSSTTHNMHIRLNNDIIIMVSKHHKLYADTKKQVQGAIEMTRGR